MPLGVCVQASRAEHGPIIAELPDICDFPLEHVLQLHTTNPELLAR